MGIKHVHGSTTSLNGCKIDIDGDLDYSLIPPRINGFHGYGASKWRARGSKWRFVFRD